MITSSMIEEAYELALATFADTNLKPEVPEARSCTDVTEYAIQDIMGDLDIERQSGIIMIQHNCEVTQRGIQTRGMCGPCALRAGVFMGFLIGVLSARAEAEETY